MENSSFKYFFKFSKKFLAKFIKVLIENGIFFSGVSIGLLLSIIFPHPEMALSLFPVIIIPLLVFAGFFVNQNNIPYYFYPIQYISFLKYGFQAKIMVQFLFFLLPFLLIKE